jgi:transcriptional regulator GlxA family with amidase domain
MERRRTLTPFAVLLLPLVVAALGCRPSEPEGGETAEVDVAAAPEADTPPVLTDPEPVERAPFAYGDTPPDATVPTDRKLRAGFLIVDGVYNTELMAPYDVFQHTVYHAQPGIEVFTVSPDGKPVTTFEGLRIVPHHSFRNAPPLDILVVPSADGSMDRDLKDEAMIRWVRETGERARHVVSLCDGAFVLAQAGLLEGIPATTFPADYERFSQSFPGVDLRINVSFVDAGKVLTSEGGARSYDVAMHLVDRIYGTKAAAGVGRGLLISWPPDPATMRPRIMAPGTLRSDPAQAAPEPRVTVPMPQETPDGP